MSFIFYHSRFQCKNKTNNHNHYFYLYNIYNRPFFNNTTLDLTNSYLFTYLIYIKECIDKFIKQML